MLMHSEFVTTLLKFTASSSCLFVTNLCNVVSVIWKLFMNFNQIERKIGLYDLFFFSPVEGFFFFLLWKKQQKTI